MIVEIIISALLFIGAFFALVGSIGLARLPDFFMRIHGPTKATTLGVGGVAAASMLYFSIVKNSVSLHEILLGLFLFMTAPISAHLASKAALHLHVYSKAKRPRIDKVD